MLWLCWVSRWHREAQQGHGEDKQSKGKVTSRRGTAPRGQDGHSEVKASNSDEGSRQRVAVAERSMVLAEQWDARAMRRYEGNAEICKAKALRRRTEQGQGGDKRSLGKAKVRNVSALNSKPVEWQSIGMDMYSFSIARH